MSDAVFREVSSSGKTSDSKPDNGGSIPSASAKDIGEYEAKSSDYTTPKAEKASDLLATYQQETGKPFVVDHYEIAHWDSDDGGGFKNEATKIEGFLKELVEKKHLDNSTKAAKDFISRLEKEAGVKNDSTARKMIKLAAYIDYKRIAMDL